MIPRPPASLVGVGTEEWTRVATLLVARGQWDPLRSTVLLAYCESYADWHRMTTQVRGREVVLQGGTRTVDAQGHVTTEGGKASPNPLLPVIDRAHRALRLALEELLRPAPWASAPPPSSSPAAAEGIWCRQPGETARAYAAFCSYRELGEGRSLVKVGQKQGKKRALVETWSTRHDWVARAHAWDEHQDAIARALSTEAIQTMRAKHASTGCALHDAGLEVLLARMEAWRTNGGDLPLTPTDIVRMVQVGAALEQSARGQAVTVPSVPTAEPLEAWASRLEGLLTPNADTEIH